MPEAVSSMNCPDCGMMPSMCASMSVSCGEKADARPLNAFLDAVVEGMLSCPECGTPLPLRSN